jgi:hypothetical protein
MKKSAFILALLLVTGFVFGQGLMYKKTKSIGVRGDKIEYSKDLEVIWENDFSNPTDWIEVHSDDPSDGPWVIGTDGPSGGFSVGMGPVESTTADNGFAMYDSDAYGEGATGSQDAILTYTSAIDCSAYSSVALQFESYYREYHGTPFVEISVDGTTWTQYEVHIDLYVSDMSDNPSLQSVNITDIAAGESTVYIRFHYLGECDYAWMVDDVKFFVAPDHDLVLLDARVNFFEYPQWTDPETYPLSGFYGYSGFFGQIPKCVVDGVDDLGIVFDGVIKNFGSMEAAPILNVSVKNPSGVEIFSNSVAYEDILATEELDTLGLIDLPYEFGADPVYGAYEFTISVSEEGIVDENMENNSITYTIDINYGSNINSATYARDNKNITGSWNLENNHDGNMDGDMVGVVYPFFTEGSYIDYVDVFISSMTDVNTSFVVKLLRRGEGSDAWSQITSSSLFTITDEEAVDTWHQISFPDVCSVEFDDGEDMTELLVAVEYYDWINGNSFSIGVDGSAPTSGFETWTYIASEDTWYNYRCSQVPLIHANVYVLPDFTENTELANTIGVFPNPTSGAVTLDNIGDADIQILNITGQVVLHVNDVQNSTTIYLSSLAQGTYLVRVVNQQGSFVKKVKVSK